MMTSLPDGPGSSPPAVLAAGRTAGSAGPQGRPKRRPAGGWPLGRLIGLAIGVMAAFSVAAIVVGSLALGGHALVIGDQEGLIRSERVTPDAGFLIE